MMYAIVKKVVTPAIISVDTLVPFSLSLNIDILLSILSFVNADNILSYLTKSHNTFFTYYPNKILSEVELLIGNLFNCTFITKARSSIISIRVVVSFM